MFSGFKAAAGLLAVVVLGRLLLRRWVLVGFGLFRVVLGCLAVVLGLVLWLFDGGCLCAAAAWVWRFVVGLV